MDIIEIEPNFNEKPKILSIAEQLINFYPLP